MSRRIQRGVLGAVCALVIGVYVYMAQSGYVASSSLNPSDAYYNLLVQGFRAGQLNLKTDVPPGLAQLADPYDPVAHSPYPVLDMSYYKGKLYLYFGVTPAVVLFWPYVALTGHYLLQKDAAVIFCLAGFLVSVGLLCALWRRYFAEVSVAVVAVCALALGLATGVPVLLSQVDVYEVAVSCGYMLTMLALGAIWRALHEPERRCRWLAAASVACGLAVGARPSLLFGAVILLVPAAQAWRERRPMGGVLAAALGPITLIGLGLMLYNFLRFDDPLEFGLRYQLTWVRLVTRRLFSWHYLWFNFRVHFLEPARWSARSPFVHEAAVPPWPAGYLQVARPFGVLTNIPLAWLALAAPVAWRSQSGQTRSILKCFVGAVVLLLGGCALPLGLYCFSNFRYEVDFLPALLLSAVVGVLGLERALAASPAWRRAARCGWGLLLSFSVAFNLLASVERCAEADNDLGMQLQGAGQVQEAIRHYEQALRLYPDLADAHVNLGNAVLPSGRIQEAIGHYEQALRIKPDSSKGHNDFGIALFRLGRLPEAISHYEQALRIKPAFFEAHNNLGNALLQSGRIQEAIEQYKQALRINPDYVEAHYNLGLALVRLGRLQEAMGHWEQALRIDPDYAEAHNNLGTALGQTGRIQEAIGHFEQALRIKPDFAEAHNNLGEAFLQEGKVGDAIGQYEQALRIKPDYAEARYNLGNVFLQEGKVSDAIGQYEQALQSKPDYAEAHYNLGITLEQAGRQPEAKEHYEQALRIKPDYADAHNNLGNVFLQEGKVSDAIGQYEQALRIKPDYTEAHYNLGLALARLGRIQEAVGHWEQALQIKPDYAEAHYNLGMALEQSGRRQEALEHYEQALRSKPNYTEAQNALARLRAGQ